MEKKGNRRYIFRIALGAAMCLVVLFGILVKRCEGQEGQVFSDALVQIRAGALSGSGVIYKQQDDNLVILTAAHVLEQAEGKIQICFRDGFMTESSVYEEAEDADLAFIRLFCSEIPPENAAEYAPVRTDKGAYDALQRGDSVWVTGKDWDGTISISQGTLEEAWIYTEDFGQYMMLVRGTADPGMSGGGVFDGNGNFIGILCGGSPAVDTAEEEGGNIAGELAVLPLGIIEAGYGE